MRYNITIVLSLLSGTLMAQTYSKVVSDEEIVNFINQDIQRDSIKEVKTIRKEIFKLYKDVFYYKDSADYVRKNNFANPEFIFKKWGYEGIPNKKTEITNDIDTLFSRQDLDFFLEQINGVTKRRAWKKEFNNSKLVDNVKLDSYNRAESVMYSYSLPLFSFDKRKAIIIKGFFCGLVCGGGAYYIYEKTNTNEWQLIKKINEWAE